MIMMMSFSSQKVASESGVICTPVPSLCPTGRDGTLPLVKESTM